MAASPEAGPMPLYDHFHKPLVSRRAWESFHSMWAVMIESDLNRRLPRRLLAENGIHLGPRVEADVAEFDEEPDDELRNGHPADAGGLAVAVGVFTPPVATASVPAVFPDEFLIEVLDLHRGRQLLAVIELVSPGNKKEPAERNQFAGKWMSYLNKGVGLVVIDIVTDRHANLHNHLVELAGHPPASRMAADPGTYCVAYRPVRRGPDAFFDQWHHPLAVGSPLPTVPLYLKGYGCVRLDLEATYAEACERSRIP